MALNEYKAEKKFYKMGELAEMFDVKLSLIRFWSERFDVLKPKRNAKGNRLFTPEDVKNIELIYHLTRERGMTLAGVDKYLKNNREAAERDTEIVHRLQTVRSLLAEIRQELKDDEPEPAPEPPAADFWSDEQAVEDLRDEVENVELSVPFYAQPLFDLEDKEDETTVAEAPGEAEAEETSSVVDTQQSLF